MITFDKVLETVISLLAAHKEALKNTQPIVINRDLNGRVRLVISAQYKDEFATPALKDLSQSLTDALGKHGFPASQMILFEEDIDSISYGVSTFPVEGIPGLRLIDRLATESHWASIAPVSEGAPRIVFFSIKGGVGRSTAMAASAWSLAQLGKRVLVLDMDLESPGLSSALLPEDRRPSYGITDWLVEDLVDNGDAVFEDLIATSTLTREGEIYVVPAHGRKAGEYIAKLGRVWMPKITPTGREGWSQRLGRLIDGLEAKIKPDVILIDSRSGIDDVSSSCVTDLGASLVLLFAVDGEQTWSGYELLFDYWKRAGVSEAIREQLQLVGAMIPEVGAKDYFDSLRESGCDLFTDGLYDAVPSGQTLNNYWNFDNTDETAPHYPWAIRWNRGFAALSSLHERMNDIEEVEVNAVFGELISGLNKVTAKDNENA